MTNQLIINITPFENRVALLENGVVLEYMVDRHADRGLVGDIFLGKVQRVLPGMQAAFVELGVGKAAFLYVRDVLPPDVPEEETDLEDVEESTSKKGVVPPEHQESDEREVKVVHESKRRLRHKIEDLLKPGQDILVQVTKDSIGTKGPRVTCNISLPGRHLVFMPTYDHVGISRKITDMKERDRLRSILSKQRPKGCGFVARTVSQNVKDEKLIADCAFLVSIWNDILVRKKTVKPPRLLQPELDLVLKCTRDMTNDYLDRIIIDDEGAFRKVQRFLKFLDPELVEKIELYQGKEPIYSHYSIESEISKAMSRKVWLRSGGYLVFDQVEALTAIDVNTGKFVGKRNFEETILRTNLEAVKETAYQLRLRNIGGMVIIDFIDMESQEDRDKVLVSLMEALKKDKARCNVVKISELGLVEMTRQRNRESLEHQMCEPCFYCDGKGSLKAKRTIAYEVFRTLLQRAKMFMEPSVVVHAHPEIVDLIYGEESEMLHTIEGSVNKQVVIRPRGSFHQEQFDVFGSKFVERKSE